MVDASPASAVRRAKFLVGGLVVVLLIGVVVVFVLRSFQAHALAEATQVHARQYVTIVTPQAVRDGLPLTLPGTLQGAIETTIYARSNGYVTRWTKDIGASVKKGELLAEITAPEIDQELSQAEAARALASSSEELAKSTADRWKSLREKDAVTQQDFDERKSAYAQSQANLAAAQANVARLRNLTGFNKVVAPFDGVITSRNVDVGDLVNAGNGGAGKALFNIAQIDPLRLYVYVPQNYAQDVKVGDVVTVTLAANSDSQFKGTVAHTARAIDTATRTMQVEIRLPNPNGALIAGSYVQVLLPIKENGGALVVPTNVLLFRPDGTRVALVDAGGQVHLSSVQLGTDFGKTVAILSGLKATDQVVLNPPDSLADGDRVSVPAAPASPAGEAPPAAAAHGT